MPSLGTKFLSLLLAVTSRRRNKTLKFILKYLRLRFFIVRPFASVFERDFCFVTFATASRGKFKFAADYPSSPDLKFLHNSQNRLAILPLIFLRSNLKFVDLGKTANIAFC